MEVKINVIQTELSRRLPLDIPWIRLWEKERVRSNRRSAEKNDQYRFPYDARRT